jgi:hypothetical protein
MAVNMVSQICVVSASVVVVLEMNNNAVSMQAEKRIQRQWCDELVGVCIPSAYAV